MRRLAAAAPILLALAVAAFITLNLTIGLHPDDVKIIADSADSSYGDLWTSPFLDRFYRPLVVTCVRLSLDLFDDVAIPLRVLQGGLIIAIVATLVTTLRDRVNLAARYTAALYALASPLTFVSVSLFAVGIGDLIVGLMFVLAVRTALLEGKPAWWIAFSIIALCSKESGVLVAAYCVLEAGRRRQFAIAGVICAAVLAYLYFRTTFVHRSSFEFSTGFFFETYSPAELDREFGGSPLRLYVYNIAANLVNAITGFPDRGELKLVGRVALLMPATVISTALIARYLTVQRRWKALAPFVVVLLLNAIVGYAYVRSRIMFVGAFSIAILLAYTIDDLIARTQRVLGITGRRWAAILICLWIAVLVHSLARLRFQAAA